MRLPSKLVPALLALAACATAPETAPPAPAPAVPVPARADRVEPARAKPVFREPFTLTLHVDAESYYEEEFGPVPYVHEGSVYLFKGDHFGLRFDGDGSPVYEADAAKADLELEFTEEVKPDKTSTMLLVLTSRLQKTCSMRALMTVPDRQEILETTILPLRAGITSYESWTHPIVQLVLQDFRIEP